MRPYEVVTLTEKVKRLTIGSAFAFLLLTTVSFAQDEASIIAAENTLVDAAVGGESESAGGAGAAEALAPVDAAEAEIARELDAAPEVEAPVDEPAEAPAVESAEAPAVEPAEAPAVESAEAPAVESAEAPAVESAEAPAVDDAAEPEVAETEPVEDTAAVSPQVAGVLREEVVRRRAQDEHARESLQGAEEAMAKKDYENASKMYDEARKWLGIRPGGDKDVQHAKRRLGEAYYKWALMLRRLRDLTEAERKANLAVAEQYPGAEKLVEAIKIEKKGQPEKPPTIPSKRWKEPDFNAKETTVSEMLARGRQYYMTGELDDSQKMYESVLKRDPYNTEAIRLMDKVAQKRFDRATMELEATRTEMMAELRKTWNPRDYGVHEKTGVPGAIGSTAKITEPKNESSRLQILEKMGKIRIPDIDFRQANINDVIAFLQNASVEYDPDPAEDQRGINLILHLGAAAAPDAPSEEGAYAEFPEAAAEPAAATEVPLITFTARRISLLEALKIVTSVAELKFRIDDTVVMIVPVNAADGAIVQRMYDVLPTVSERIATTASEAGARRDEDSEFHDIGGGLGITTERTEWKVFFGQMGVKWPNGSTIKYLPSIGKIVVANTADNLTDFEKILGILNVVPNQIEIETRFVEVLQTDSSSLGFEWLLNDDWEIAQKTGQDGLPVSSRQKIQMSANDESGGFTKGNRYFNQLADGTTASLGAADDLVTIASVLTNPELSLIIHALEQKGNADLLSAPKVTTQSGQEAVIKVVTEYIYPTEFEVTPIAGTVDGVATIVGGVVEPGGFETREVGVILRVRPEVSPEGQMITLELTPEVVTEPEWKEYGSTYTAPDGSMQQLTMQMPFFHTRAISTVISIYNGATVVMGGMIIEERLEVDDKIPFLGDIPLIGRLFQSRYDTSEKRNLLLFVTARLVDPAGRPVSAQSAEGPK